MRAALLCAAIMISLGVGTVGAGDTHAGDGPVARWTFDGTLKDSAGDAKNDLTPRDGRGARTNARCVAASELPATSGRAVALGVQPGDAQYLTAPAGNDLKLGPNYTIETWIYPTRVGGWNRLVLRWGSPPNYAYHVGIHDGRASLYHNQADGEYRSVEGGRIVAGRWYHLAAVARRNDADPSQSTLTVYVNAQRAATARFDGTIKTLAIEGLGIGDSAGAPSDAARYRGYLDDLAIWNRALPAEEISAHYAQRAGELRKLELAVRNREIARRAELSTRLRKYGCHEIVFAQRGYGRDISGHYYANFGYACTDPNVWFHAGDGGQLCKLHVGTGKLTVLLDDPGGSIRDPQVHYQARKILFSYRKAHTHRYHLYEINTDGSGLRQITDGPWDDVEGTYLPGGDVIFCSTRCNRWIGCWLAETAILFRCNPQGENIRMLSSGSFTENTPAVLPDGRVLYTRWEYVNRDPVSFHHLWTMNPDGTGQMVYFGNMRPGGVFIDARPIPGTDRVVLANIPGHGSNEHVGYVATVSVKNGPNARWAMKNVSRSRDFRDPYPLSAEAFLVARGNEILLMDSQGDTEVLYSGTAGPLHEPRPIVTRPRERIVPSRLDLSQAHATLIVGDVYRGRNMAGVRRGSIKKLLVMEDLPKPANFHGGGSQPIGHGVTSTLKRILGTVPVEPDGSAHFQVPAMRSIYFALLDQNDLSVKQMRSFVTLQPGETVSCIGCHEQRQQKSADGPRLAVQAVSRDPSRIRPIPDVPPIMDFPRDVQPILDRHCVSCHNHRRCDGGVSLVGDRGPVFSQSYYTLLLHWQIKDTGGQPRHGTGREPGNNRPYTTYSSASPLMAKLEPGHYDVRLSPREKRLIRLWIDTGATYAGTYAAYGSGQVGGCWGNNQPIRVMADDWPSTAPAQEAVQRRCGACHPRQQLPQHVTARISVDSWGDMLSWTRPLSRYSRHRIYNLGRPEASLILLAPLSHKAGGYARGIPGAEIGQPRPVAEDRSRPPQPVQHPIVFADAADPDYRKILVHIRAAAARLGEIKRFDMPGFRPNEHYVREMKRYGVLPGSLDPAKDPIDVYATDRAYWQTFWYRPVADPSAESGP